MAMSFSFCLKAKSSSLLAVFIVCCTKTAFTTLRTAKPSTHLTRVQPSQMEVWIRTGCGWAYRCCVPICIYCTRYIHPNVQYPDVSGVDIAGRAWPVEQEEDGEPLADVLHEDAAGRAPVREHDLEHREEGPAKSTLSKGAPKASISCKTHATRSVLSWNICLESFLLRRKETCALGAVVSKDAIPQLHVVAGVLDELPAERGHHHARHALHEGEEQKAPKEHVP